METNNEHTQTQLDHWRQACSKLTSLVEEKDEDLRECSTQRKEAEESYALAEAQKRTLEIQVNLEIVKLSNIKPRGLNVGHPRRCRIFN